MRYLTNLAVVVGSGARFSQAGAKAGGDAAQKWESQRRARTSREAGGGLRSIATSRQGGEGDELTAESRPSRRGGRARGGRAAGVVAGATTGGDGATARAAANVTITARDFFWSPDAVTIQVGDTVTWTNAQGFHNVLLGDSRLNQPGFPTDAAWQPPPQGTFTARQLHLRLRGPPGHDRDDHRRRRRADADAHADADPTPAVPPPGGGAPDTTAPVVSDITVSGSDSRARVRLTVSERSTVNVRFADGDDVAVCARRWSRAPGRSSASSRPGATRTSLGGGCHGQPLLHHAGEVTIRG